MPFEGFLRSAFRTQHTMATTRDSFELVKDKKLHYSPTYQFKDEEAHAIDLSSLPLKDVSDGATAVVHIFDVINDVECGELALEHLPLFDAKNFGSLPVPFAPGAEIEQPFAMDVVVIPNSGRPPTIIKHFRAEGARFTRRVALSLCRGQPKILNLTAQGQTTMKALMHMLDCASGVQFRSCKLINSGATAPAVTEDAGSIGRGYDYIRKGCPATAEGLARLKWIAKEVIDERSPHIHMDPYTDGRR